MRRGDLVTVALYGGQGKPRPALIVQSDLFDELGSITVLPITGALTDAPLFRVPVDPTAQNGLSKPSQIMVDKPQTPARNRVGSRIGHLDDATVLRVNCAVAVFLGLA